MDDTLRYNSAMLDFLVEYFYDHGIWHVAEPTNIPIYVGPITIQPKYNDVWTKNVLRPQTKDTTGEKTIMTCEGMPLHARERW